MDPFFTFVALKMTDLSPMQSSRPIASPANTNIYLMFERRNAHSIRVVYDQGVAIFPSRLNAID